ncbi:exonuclease domain-containing protein [Candidatus Poriferisodalis sp.]|uniref:exonuclease domain-containing protein n=1 Tax=Candidatus Poriferisodalis sp. TaxID=3101277 RepID=UPI003D14F9E6
MGNDWTGTADVKEIGSTSNLRLNALSGFAAVDVETANEQRRSICEIAVVTANSGGALRRRSWLAQPPANRYERANIDVHGITAADTNAAPRFSAIWPQVRDEIGERGIVAHNAEFDIDCIAKTLRHYRIDWEPSTHACTLRIADLVLSDRVGKFTLGALCRDLGIEIPNAHRAASDAEAVLLLAAALYDRSDERSFQALVVRSDTGWRERREASVRRAMYASTDPATARQIDYLRLLLQERRQTMSLEGITKGDASRAIDSLKTGRSPNDSRT